MTGNRIELEGRLLDQPEVRITPAGTPVLRFTVDCGAPGEELRLGIVMTGESALAAKPLLAPGRAGQGDRKNESIEGQLEDQTIGFEVVAASIERR